MYSYSHSSLVGYWSEIHGLRPPITRCGPPTLSVTMAHSVKSSSEKLGHSGKDRILLHEAQKVDALLSSGHNIYLWGGNTAPWHELHKTHHFNDLWRSMPGYALIILSQIEFQSVTGTSRSWLTVESVVRWVSIVCKIQIPIRAYDRLMHVWSQCCMDKNSRATYKLYQRKSPGSNWKRQTWWSKGTTWPLHSMRHQEQCTANLWWLHPTP